MFVPPSQRGRSEPGIYHAVSPGPPTPDPVPALRRLHPEPGQIEIGDLLAGLDLAAQAPADRPYTIVNFVASADGHAAFQGRSRWLSDAADRELFHRLREHVDAVMAGTGTLRAERYGRMVRDPERRHRRAEAGLEADPLAVVISRSGEVPTDIPLFSDADSHVAVFASAELDTDSLAARVDVVRLDPGELTLTTMMRRLRSDFGVRSLLCEGGPILFGALLRERLVDELFLSLAPKLTGGGSAPAISSGPELAEPCELSLIWALEFENALYLRYRLRP
jgi:riboflavin-specific deaminase-like protein